MLTISDFTNLYPVSKTLRWALRPIGKTAHYINENHILENDRQKARTYEKAKKVLDEVYKDFINVALGSMGADEKYYSVDDYNQLSIALDDFQRDKAANRDNLYKSSAYCRNRIVNHLKQLDEFKSFAGSGKAREVLAHAYEKDEDGTLKSIFDRFSGYFNGYCQNRANLFSPEAKASSLAYRIVDENFPKFHRNYKTLSLIKEKYIDLFNEITTTVANNFGIADIELFFSNEKYCDYMIQKGIDYYNLVIGGKTLEDGKKLQGINELVNLYCQSHDGVKKRDLLFVPLFKQLMEERNKVSFIPRQCESDEELVEVVKTTISEVDSIHRVLSTISDYKSYDEDSIYVSNKQIPSLSMDLFGPGRWDSIFNCMIEDAKGKIIRDNGTETLSKKQQKVIEGILKQDYYSLGYLEKVIEGNKERVGMAEDYENKKSLLDVISNKSKLLSNALSTCLNNYTRTAVPKKIRDDVAYLEILKAYLDSLLESEKFIRSFIPTADYEGDAVFYEGFSDFESSYRKLVRIYDFSRNYATREVSSEEKYKLNFNCSTLANGWDRNKEWDNLCVILRKDGNYYLAIRNKMNDSSVLVNGDNCRPGTGEAVYEKMIYKYLPSPSKMLPKVFFSKLGRQLEYGPDSALVNAYEEKKAGNIVYYEKDFGTEKEYITSLIKFYQQAIPQYGDWIEFGMVFKSPEEYDSLNEFYQDIEKQNFFISFENVSERAVSEMVESGKIFLFQIYNKDFSEGSSGSKNLHTLYWEYLFSEDNLTHSHTVKLNGEAELFFRPAVSHSDAITHPKGTYLVNRNTSDGRHIPDKYHKEIYEFANGRLKTLSNDAKSWYECAVIKKADKNLIKGKRFITDQFSFHVPITINYNASNDININEATCSMLISNPDCNIIGIDRGERNLLYISVINQKGEILFQKSLNQIPSSNNRIIDYYSKLEDAEIARNEARKSWGTIGKIANLKEGYLSTVIPLISNLMIKYNAIVVLENLNTGFKRGRFKFERQVYQKFEAALISKMELLILKESNQGEIASIPKALQLAEKFESFEKIGTQTGWLFYVPAEYTSKIDPTTGFANLFNLKDLTNFEKKKDFFRKFKSIRYDNTEKDFKFSFSYSDFNCFVSQKKFRIWELSSRGERILHSKDGSVHKEKPTERIKEILNTANVVFESGDDLVPCLSNLQRSKENITFLDEFYRTFTLILQMRNSCASTGDDYIISPVKGPEGYYDSRNYDSSSRLPCDADANGAYNIARKGILMINKLRNKPDDIWNATKISREEWFDYVER